MAFIMRKKMVTGRTLQYLIPMLSNMEHLDNGLLKLKIKQFLPLSLAPLGLQRTPPGGSTTPSTPALPRKYLEDKKRGTGARASGGLLPRHLTFHPDDDEDEENKENFPPQPVDETKEEGPTQEDRHLQEQLGKLITRLREDIYQDLEYFRRKLGIRT
uniref:E4 protein n=1 Tax=Human papillomavirus TaxID=10566 RepID=A0A385PJD4_9PAPI|nr:MAG: E4 protein [Human papillomavirus]